ncbi:MAG: aminopeptidase [delta proteobacterium ML8_F1]|nr:MAG: aminopeptidase [delta proteobacterium ML8_F1]
MSETSFGKKSAWLSLEADERDRVFSLGEEYKYFIDTAKTEREAAALIAQMAAAEGYFPLEDYLSKQRTLGPGEKIYALNKHKSVILFVMGQEPLEKGMRIVGAHIDSPRLDLKPVPVYEDTDLCLMKTHYYGGVKKYQWTSMPLALHGVIVKGDGTKLEVAIGEGEEDPVFYISDLLPHLAKDQMQKKASEFIEGEDLNLLVGNIPLDGDEKQPVKAGILEILKQTYHIDEKDFLSGEFEVVPAGKARDVGFDRSMISGYGHDDRVCSFAGVKGMLDIETPKFTAVGMFMDKEEVGSKGNTGSESKFFENVVAELINLQEEDYSDLYLRRAFMETRVLSADVNAAFDPGFKSVYDKSNTGFLGGGLQVTKYTGSRGKSGCSDANAEFLAEVAKLFDDHQVTWQTGELGKVDQGGGGTIAYILANLGAEVVDCGIPLLSMHAPYELLSKVDLYMAYKGYRAFLG